MIVALFTARKRKFLYTKHYVKGMEGLKVANKFLARLVIGVLGVVGCAAASAAPYVVGQVFASIGGGLVNVYNPDGTFVQTLNTGVGGFTTGSTFDSTGKFYVTAFSNGSVAQFDGNGTLVTATWASGLSTGESIVFDAAGRAYIGQSGAASIRLVNASGATLNTFTTLQNTDWIDLAADNVTLLYSNEGSVIRQLNTSTLVDTVFVSCGCGPLFAKRYLADGGVIAASGNGNVYRWNSAGVLQQTYAIGFGVFALNLDPDGTSFWTGATGGVAIRRIDLTTGAVLASWNTTGTLFGLSVFGEIQAGGGGGGGGNVPEPGTIALLGLGLIALAFVRRRKFMSA
jgi:WD40 repeat protein